MKMKVFVFGTALLWGSLMAASLASAQGDKVQVYVNGVEVQSPLNHIANNTTYVEVAAYMKLIGGKFEFDADKKALTVKGKQIAAVHVMNGIPTAPVRELAKAAGAEKITWNRSTSAVEVVDLGEGIIQLTPSVPGMGEHWANPKDLPVGPIYGVENGKIVFIEQMLKQEDFADGKSFENIAGMKGLPSPSVEHTDIEFQPNGHEGFEIPHYDLHHYFVTHEEHQSFGKPAKQG